MEKQFANRKKTEGSLLVRATVMDTVKDCVIATDPEGKITYWNQGASAIFGYSRAEMLGVPLARIGRADEQKKDAARQPDSFFTETPVSTEWEGVKENGEAVWVLFTRLPLRDGDGRASGVVHIGKDMSEHRKAAGALREKLTEQSALLEQKDSALRELMSQSLAEKERIEKQVQANVDHLLRPVVEKLKGKGSLLAERYTSLLEANLKEITSGFGTEISSRMLSLTPREIDVCNMIKNGFSSKQISEAMNISIRTVETHRNSVRKKLTIAGKEVNLATYLKHLQ